MLRCRRACAALGAVVLSLLAGSAFADHFTADWAADAVGNWTDVGNWSTDPAYPDNGSDTFDAVIDSAAAQVTLDTPITIVDFTLSNGTMLGDETLNLSTMHWDGGTLYGNGTLQIGSGLIMNGGSKSLGLFNFNLSSTATSYWYSGNIDVLDELDGGGFFTNNGIFEDMADAGLYWGNALTPIFNNSGRYNKSDGAFDRKEMWAEFNNSGTVSVQAAGIWFAGGGHNTGTFTGSAGTRLIFSDFNAGFGGAGAPTTTFSASAVINSLGTVEFCNNFGVGTTEFSGTYDAAHTVIDNGVDTNADPVQFGRVTFKPGALVNTNFSGSLDVLSGVVRFETGSGSISFTDGMIAGGTIDSDEDLFFNTLAFNSGTLVGSGTTSISAATITFGGSGSRMLRDADLYNGVDGIATMSQGTLSMQDAAVNNLAGAVFDFQGDARLRNVDASVYAANFGNGGTLIKSGGTGVSELYDVFLGGNGMLSVQSGTLALNGGSEHSGTILIGSGATLVLGPGSTGATHEFLSGSTTTGDPGSDFQVFAASTFNAGSSATLGRLTAMGSAATLNFSGDMAAQATDVMHDAVVNFRNGSFSAGSLALTSGGQVILDAGSDKTLMATSITTDVPNGSKLDLADNEAVIDYSGPTPVDSIRMQILTGYAGGAWTGNGITSFSAAADPTMSLGYADDTGAMSILIKYTFAGDANLDGTVDILDLQMLAAHWQGAGIWTGGDFDYNGTVNGIDLGVLAGNWQAGAGLAAALNSLSLPPASVPEPTGLLMLFIPALLGRRYRAMSATPHSGHITPGRPAPGARCAGMV